MAERKKAETAETIQVHIAPTYTVYEFSDNAEKVFGAGVSRDCVTAAFKMAGIREATIEDAKALVKKFISKEVM